MEGRPHLVLGLLWQIIKVCGRLGLVLARALLGTRARTRSRTRARTRTRARARTRAM